MDAERYTRLKQAFQDLLEVGPAQRATAVERLAGVDAELAAELARWLASEERDAGAWLETPAAGDPDLAGAAGGTTPTEGGGAIPERIGPWRLEAEIGRGGMGSVYRGRRDDGAFEQTVAIKLIRSELASEVLRRRFLAERRILAGLVHPNIAHLIDGGSTPEGVPYLVLEHVAGEPIDQYCDRLALPVDRRLRLFLVVCDAVHFAHQKLVLHRDLKSANVLVDHVGEPKLLDFGIAKLITLDPEEEDLTALGLGRPLTLEWASPEQLRGDPLTTAADVYSLGVLLRVLLTGRRPHRWSGQAPAAFAREIEERRGSRSIGSTSWNDATPPPGVLGKSLRGDLQRIVEQALAPELARRYGTVAELGADLDRYLAGLPVVAHPPSVRYRLGKFLRRHRAAVAAGALAALVMVVGLLAIASEARRARLGEERARARFDDARRLANAALFDLHDAIRDLPGSLPARRALAQHALEYLEVLAEEASADPTLRLELATAYRKVGDVQGGIFLGSSGDTAAAVANYQRAADLLDRLAGQGEPNPDRLGALADELLAVGDGFQSTGDYRRAALVAERAIALRRSLPAPLLRTPQQQLQIGIAQVRLGRALREQGELEPALAATDEGVRVLEPLAAAAAAPPGAERQLAKAYNQQGSILPEPERALAAHEQALGILTTLLAAEPVNAQLERELGWTLGDMTRALLRIGDAARSERNLRRAAAIFERQLSAHPGNAVDALDLANVLIALGWTQTTAGDLDAALANLSRAQRLAETALVTDPESNWASETIWQVYRQLGDTTAAAATTATIPARAEGFARAGAWYARSREVLAALAAERQLQARYAVDLEELDQKIARCERDRALSGRSK